MRTYVFKRGLRSILRDYIVHLLFILGVLGMVLYGLDRTERAQRAEGLRFLQEGILRALVTCYAVEGYYPESVVYLEEHYGVRIDSTKYEVDYSIFSENIMPVVTVVTLEP